MASREAPFVTRSPRLDGSPISPSFPSSQPRPRSSSPGVFSAPPMPEGDRGDSEEESKEWREDTRLMFAAEEETREGAELLLPAHAQLGALIFVVTASVVQVVASKAVLNSVQTPFLFVVSTLAVQLTFMRLWASCGYCTLPKLSRGALESCSRLVAVTVLGLVFNTIALQSLDLSFYQIARGLSLPFSSFLSRAFLGFPSPPFSVTASSLVVALGFLLAALAEPSSSGGSILFAALGAFLTALQAVFLKRAHTSLGGNATALDLVWYSYTMAAFIVGALALLVGEGPFALELLSPLWTDEAQVEGIGSAAAYEGAKADLWTFFLGTLVAAFFGFLTSIAGNFNIKITAAPIQMASTSLRGAALTWLAVVLFADILTPARLIGILLVVFGGIFYTHFKSQAPLLPSSLTLHTSPSAYHSYANPSSLPTATSGGPSSLSRPRKPRPLSLSPETARRPTGAGVLERRRSLSPTGTATPSPSPKLGNAGGFAAHQQQQQETPRMLGESGSHGGKVGVCPPVVTRPLEVEKRFGESDEEGEESAGSEGEDFKRW